MMKDDRPMELKKGTLAKELGVHLELPLKCREHCEQRVNTRTRKLGLIWCSYPYLDGENLVKLFTALVRPLFKYDNAVWYLCYEKDSAVINHVQRCACKL